jgi:hypothetical protein
VAVSLAQAESYALHVVQRIRNGLSRAYPWLACGREYPICGVATIRGGWYYNDCIKTGVGRGPAQTSALWPMVELPRPFFVE